MERAGVNARSTGLAVTIVVLISDIALVGLFLLGVVYALAKKNVPGAYVVVASIVLPVLVVLVGLVFLFAFRRELGATVVRAIASGLKRIWHRIDPDALARHACEIADQARAALTGRAFAEAIGLAFGNWIADIEVLYLFFVAVGHHQHFGALLVAYVVANLVSAIPITPSGLGVMEATLVGISVGFGAPRSAAVVAVLGYRLVNFWLPLPVGLAAYIRSRTPAAAG
jgi:uncharacterized protein (TIRG00374 family)